MTTIKMCDAFIEIPADLWASCYCKLPAGHDGKHSAHYPTEHLQELMDAAETDARTIQILTRQLAALRSAHYPAERAMRDRIEKQESA
jgi:hypothetical protein